MSYLDPIQTALDKSSPIPHGGLKAIAQLSGIVSIPISIYVFVRASQSGWDNLPWPVVPGVIFLLVAGFGAICAVLILFALLLQGVPETLTVIEGHFSDYYRRNVVGYTLLLVRRHDGIIAAQVLPRRSRKILGIGPDPEMLLPLGGWFRKGWLRDPIGFFTELQLVGIGTETVSVFLRLREGRISLTVEEVFCVLGVCQGGHVVSWQDIIVRSVKEQQKISRDIHTAIERAEALNKRANAEEARANRLMSLHLTLLRKIGETKRLQHSKDGERLRLEAMEKIPPFFPEGHPTRKEFESEISQLKERIARREGAKAS